MFLSSYPNESVLNFISQLLRSSHPAAAPEAATWQPVALTPAQTRRHTSWLADEMYRNWLAPYFKAYHLQKGGAAGVRGLRVELLREPGRQGALLHYDASIQPGNFRHFFEYIGERIVALGYHRAATDGRRQAHAHHTEYALKQFFKPDPLDCPYSGQCNQRFGLVTLDLLTVNEQPLFIRLLTNPLEGSEFTAAASFDSLLQAVFDAPLPTPGTEAKTEKYRYF